MKRVTKEEFDAWLEAYPWPLERDVLTICTPEKIQYNDFSLGKWPQSVVAQYSAWGCDPTDIYADVPGDWAVKEQS